MGQNCGKRVQLVLIWSKYVEDGARHPRRVKEKDDHRQGYFRPKHAGDANVQSPADGPHG
jgi:hypothetical protein